MTLTCSRPSKPCVITDGRVHYTEESAPVCRGCRRTVDAIHADVRRQDATIPPIAPPEWGGVAEFDDGRLFNLQPGLPTEESIKAINAAGGPGRIRWTYQQIRGALVRQQRQP